MHGLHPAFQQRVRQRATRVALHDAMMKLLLMQVVNFGAWYLRFSVLDPHHAWPAWQTDIAKTVNRLSISASPEQFPQTHMQVVNFGAWYPRYSVLDPHHPWPAWQTDMKELINERLSTYQATTFWRSYSAAHYGGTNGTNTFEEVGLTLPA